VTAPSGGAAAAALARITEWLEHDLGGRVVRIERQARWRPAWWADLERDGELLPLYVRGDRVDSPSAFPLEHERVFHQMLGERGIRVPRVHGYRDANPKAYVTDRVPGRADFAGETDEARRSAMKDYIDILLELHKLDVAPFARAGIVRAPAPQRSHLVGLCHFAKRAYRSQKKRPDPFLEFALAWLSRNVPRNPGREAVIVWDAGQFHQRDGRIVALLDLEFGHIGDPLADLAGLWVRNPFIPLGDVAALMRRYQDGSGALVDIVAVRWHYVLWALSNQLEFHAALADPVPGSDYMLNLHWCIETNLMALEAIAAGAGVELGEGEELVPAVSAYGPAYRRAGMLVRFLRGRNRGLSPRCRRSAQPRWGSTATRQVRSKRTSRAVSSKRNG
jgi:aminoglycoside phosphotransferase (APT) family kinase protein